MLTQSELKELMHYDPAAGQFVRLKARFHPQRIGQIAGCVNKHPRRGYVVIKIHGKSYEAHRLAWLYMTGEWPKSQIDHRDEDKTNNRWDNLREATHTQNIWHRGKQKNNASGIRGVYWRADIGKWRAVLQAGRKAGRKALFSAHFATREEAAAAYAVAARAYFGEFVR